MRRPGARLAPGLRPPAASPARSPWRTSGRADCPPSWEPSATARTRQSVVAVGDSTFYFSSGERHRIQRFSRDGRLLASLRLDREPAPVTDETIDRFVRWRRNLVSDPEAERRIEDRYRDLPRVATKPTFSALRVDAPGNLWALSYRPYWHDGPSVWLVFAPDGRFLGEVRTPAGFTPHEIGADFVLGRSVGAADVEYVERYRLVEPGG